MENISKRGLLGLFAGVMTAAAWPAVSAPVTFKNDPPDEGEMYLPVSQGAILMRWGRFDVRRKRKPWPAKTVFKQPFAHAPISVQVAFDAPVRGQQQAEAVVWNLSHTGFSLMPVMISPEHDESAAPCTGYWLAISVNPAGGGSELDAPLALTA